MGRKKSQGIKLTGKYFIDREMAMQNAEDSYIFTLGKGFFVVGGKIARENLIGMEKYDRA